MQWVRTNRRFGAWCALAAIALQIILSFGHTHFSNGIPGAPWAQAAASDHTQSIERSGHATMPLGVAFEYCAICAAIKMGAAAVPPETPAWSVPFLAGEVRFAPPAEAPAWTLARLLFQARAPPSA